jgi:hypothetical protein
MEKEATDVGPSRFLLQGQYYLSIGELQVH